MSPFVLGMDIGYSNLKLVFAPADSKDPRTKVMPAGAAPHEMITSSIKGDGPENDYLCVTLDGEKWVAGVEGNLIGGNYRQLHKNYSTTQAYQALFYAALHTAAMQGDCLVIDRLVTGLPVDQHQDAAYKNALADRLTGIHKISPLVQVEVKETIVLPQPAGAYLDQLDLMGADAMSDAVAVVIDPGFFSVDYVVLQGSRIQNQSSGTSKRACSVLIEAVDEMVRDDLGRLIGTSRIESAIRTGRYVLKMGPTSIDLGPYIAKAAAQVAPQALSHMQAQMRHEDVHPDFVILAGGGSKLYEEAARAIFPNVEVVSNPDPVLANAMGFWLYGAAL